MKVVFPNPDSPATYTSITSNVHKEAYRSSRTIMVKAAPLFATILCLHPSSAPRLVHSHLVTRAVPLIGKLNFEVSAKACR